MLVANEKMDCIVAISGHIFKSMELLPPNFLIGGLFLKGEELEEGPARTMKGKWNR